jgi:hypothetical protein
VLVQGRPSLPPSTLLTLSLPPTLRTSRYGHLRRETSHSIKDEGVIVDRLRGGYGYSTRGDKNYREPQNAAGYHGEQQAGGLSSSSVEAKPARWYQDPAGPRPKIAWLGQGPGAGSGQRSAGRPLWEAPLSAGGAKGGGSAVHTSR